MSITIDGFEELLEGHTAEIINNSEDILQAVRELDSCIESLSGDIDNLGYRTGEVDSGVRIKCFGWFNNTENEEEIPRQIPRISHSREELIQKYGEPGSNHKIFPVVITVVK